jgi:hypothetical protein
MAKVKMGGSGSRSCADGGSWGRAAAASAYPRECPHFRIEIWGTRRAGAKGRDERLTQVIPCFLESHETCAMREFALGASRRELAPVHAEIAEQNRAEGDGDDEDDVCRVREVPVAGPEVEQARGDERKGDGVRSHHPLPVLRDLAVARCKESGDGADDPRPCLHTGCGKERMAGADGQGQNSGQQHRSHIDPAKDAVKGPPALAQTRGELRGAAEQRERAEDRMRNEQMSVGDQLQTVAVVHRVVGDEEDFAGDEDEESGEGEDEPEGVPGAPAGGGASGGGMGGRRGHGFSGSLN